MTVTAVNDLPVITSAAITSATEGEVYSYVPTATDVENDTLTWNVGTAPAAMTVNSTTGELTWTPEEGVTSADVTLLVNDGGANVTQSFTITVTPVNDAPVITEGESVAVTMSEDGAPTSFALVLNATDADHAGTSLTWTIDAAANNGSATVTGTGNSKAVTYAPAADFSGVDSFTVAVSDGDLTDTVTVNVTVEAVNDAPVIDDESATLITDEDTEGNLTLTASDVEGDSLSWSVTTAATQGSASVSNGAITYVPAADFNGSDSFTVEVSDGNASDSITVDVTVNAANDAPEITSTAVTSATEGVAYGYTVTASDIDGDALSFALTTAPVGMTIDSVSGAISWTPGSGIASADVTVEVNDGGLTASQSFTIAVTSVNAAPVIDQGASTTLNTNEDTTATLQLSATDSDGDSLTWSISSGASKGGVAVDAAGLVTYVPAADENGSDAFEVSVFDGTETATIAVSVDIAEVNDLPVINEGSEVTLTVNEDEFGNITLTATDVDGDTLTWSVQTGAVNGIVTQTGSEFSYTPSVDFSGDDSFIVQVSDGTASGTSTVNVTVVAVNDAPVVTSSANTSATQYQVYAYDVTATDVENDAMSFSLSTAPAGMSISGTGEVRWMPDAAGTYAVVVAVSDGNATGEQSFTVTVDAAPAVNGRAVKGVMSGAIVEAAVYAGLDANGDHSWSVIGTTTTDANGYYGFDLGSQSAPVRIRVTTTVDTEMVCDTPSGCLLAPPAVFGERGAPAVDMVMDSIVTGSNFAGTIAVTPMTNMAAAWLQAFPDALDDNAVALAHTRLATLFGFDSADYVHHRMIDLTDSFERSYAVANDMQAMRHAIFSASLQETAIVASLSIDSVTDNIALIFGLLGGQMPLKSGELDVSTLGLTDPDTAEPINMISYTGFDTFVASAKTVANYVNDGDLTSMIGEFDALVTNWTPELADASLCLDNTTVDLDRSDCRNVTTIGGATGFDATLFARALAPIDVAGGYLDDAQAAELANGNTVNRDLGWLYVDEATQNETAEMLSALSTVLGYGVQTATCVPQIANSQACSVTPSVGYETLSTSISSCEGYRGDDSCTLSVSGTANGQSISVTSRVPDIRKMLGGDRIWPAPNFVAGALPLCFNGSITNSVAEMNLTNFCVILNVSDSLPGLLTPFEDLYASDYAAIGEDGSTSDDGQPSAAYTAMQNLLAKVVLEVAATGALSISDVNNTIGTYSMSNMDMSFVFDRESLVDLSKGTPVFDFEVTSFSRTNPWGETLNSVSGTPMFKLQVDDSSLLTGSNVKDNVGVPPVLSVTNAQVSGLGPVVDVAKEYALSLIDTNATVTERTQEQWDALIAEVEANLTYKGSITTTVQDAAADNPTYIATLTGDGDVFISQKNSEDNAMQLYLSGATGYVYADNMLVATAHLGNSQDGMLLSFVDGSQRSYANANPNLNSQLQSFLDFLQVLVPPTEETTTTP
ncbi:MAG: Ig-like domain-containing protein [Pseudomonadota bacterium]|nr:Ig-like domain-containing protein [Pseudomonadota bacterium]